MEKLTLKVAAESNPSSVGGAIVRNLQEGKQVEMIAVGAGAVNQAVKGFAIGSGFAAPQGMTLSMRPGFTEVEIDGVQKTAILFKIIVD